MTRREAYNLKREHRRKSRRIHMVLFVLSSALILHSAFFANADSAEKQYIEVSVKSGDTLWTIANENNVANRDVRGLIQEIKKENDLKGSALQINDVLRVPVS